MALVAIGVGAAIVYFGDRLLGVELELFRGVSTFTPLWVLDLFFVPFVAGIVVAGIYGLGGKIVAHFAPLVVRIPSYYQLDSLPVTALPDHAVLLPISYWLLVVVVSVEFAAFGGVVGEILVKKVYGRSPRALLHKRYAKDPVAPLPTGSEQPSNESNR